MQVPEGHRILQAEEILRSGDLFLNDEGAWETVPFGQVQILQKSDGFESEETKWNGPNWKATLAPCENFIRKRSDKKEIIVRSRTLAKEFFCDLPWACVSITTPGDGWPVLNKAKCMDVLQTQFYDAEFKRPEFEDKYFFGSEQANQILDFVNGVWNKIDLFMVHCQAGISRSPAIAAAIAKIKYGNDTEFFERYCPNSLVYSMLLRTATDRGEFNNESAGCCK